ncbi:MAG TPA: outer membrane lipoprotein-sorting protein [Candidatus Acidoferrales bacterium]|nr:outer membrane lipoprotein-sorting protein [Candidatus Acidoferrales bacterium]
MLSSFLIFAAASEVSGMAARAADDDAKAMVERADRIRFPAGGYQVNVKVTSTAPGKPEDVRTYEILSKGNDRTIVRTLTPLSDKGQVLLMRDKDLWIFMPAVSQPIRLSLAQRLTGQVANGDLARANFSGDYHPTVLRTETIQGEPYVVLDLRAVDRSVTYHRVLYWVNKDNFRPYRAEFYSLSGKLLKTCQYENFKQAAGEARPTRLVMEDALTEGSRSVLEYTDLKLRDLPDKMFAKDYMRRLQ